MFDKKMTKLLMIASTLFLGLMGLGVSFIPQEILTYFDVPASGPVVLLVEMLGALYMGFALLNWMARANLIGGIYSRPVAAGNFIYFMMASIILVKEALTTSSTAAVVSLALVNVVFAVSFGYLLFGDGPACQ